MKLSFELSDRDLRYFRDALTKSRSAIRYADENEIIDAIRDVLEDIQANEPLPDFEIQIQKEIDDNTARQGGDFRQSW